MLDSIGTITIPLPAKVEYNWEDLVVGELRDYSGALTLPPADPATPGVISMSH